MKLRIGYLGWYKLIILSEGLLMRAESLEVVFEDIE